MTVLLIVAFVVIVAVLAALTPDRDGPDDPWMLEHEHRLQHTYKVGMRTYDRALQEAAAKRAAEREADARRAHDQHSRPRPQIRRAV